MSNVVPFVTRAARSGHIRGGDLVAEVVALGLFAPPCALPGDTVETAARFASDLPADPRRLRFEDDHAEALRCEIEITLDACRDNGADLAVTAEALRDVIAHAQSRAERFRGCGS